MAKDSCKHRNKRIYELWEKGLPLSSIARTPFHRPLSFRRIQNIIYKKDKSNCQRNRQIRNLYEKALQRTEDPQEALQDTYNNQPPEYLSERTIRFIVNKERSKRIAQRQRIIQRIKKSIK